MTRRDPRDRRDEDLGTLIDELEGTLDELRSELRAERSGGRGRYDDGPDDRRDRRGRRDRDRDRSLRPPTFSEVLRFTDEYTIPTVIAVLEAGIESLELLRRLLRLADPGRSLFDGSDDRRRGRGRSTLSELDRRASDVEGAVTGVGGVALDGIERALDQLQTALSEADLPEDRASRDILRDARDLSAEIESRVAAARRDGPPRRDERDRRPRRDDAGRRDERDGRDGHGRERTPGRERARTRTRERTRDGAVRIDIEEEASDDDADGDRERREEADGDRDRRSDDDEAVEIDVEAELESIRREVEDARDADGTDADGDDADGTDHDA
jgi:hypothetical protein